MLKLSSFFLCLLCVLHALPALADENSGQTFSQFSVSMPKGWAGDEQTGFISDNRDEYLLTLGIKDDSGDSFKGQVSIYLLPNKPGTSSKEAAMRLAEAQGDPTEPQQKGDFWIFEGEPRTTVIKGRAITMVNAQPDKMLIIIAQDPENAGAVEIVESLRGLTPDARRLLGR